VVETQASVEERSVVSAASHASCDAAFLCRVKPWAFRTASGRIHALPAPKGPWERHSPTTPAADRQATEAREVVSHFARASQAGSEVWAAREGSPTERTGNGCGSPENTLPRFNTIRHREVRGPLVSYEPRRVVGCNTRQARPQIDCRRSVLRTLSTFLTGIS